MKTQMNTTPGELGTNQLTALSISSVMNDVVKRSASISCRRETGFR